LGADLEVIHLGDQRLQFRKCKFMIGEEIVSCINIMEYKLEGLL